MERGAKRKIRTDRVRHAVREVFEEYYPDELPHTTVKEHADRWLAAKKSEVAPSTYLSYWNSAEKFLKHIGDLAEQDICEIRKPTIASFRDHVQKLVSPTTVNLDLKAVKAIFKSAKRDGYISQDPAESVEFVRRSSDRVRRAFTLDELRAILKVADPEWESLIKFGFYTGQRLGDLKGLTWANIDLESNVLRLRTRKTRRDAIIPICEPLLDHILTLEGSKDDPKAPLHPRSAKTRVSTLSKQFVALLIAVGLRLKHQPAGVGRGGRRQQSEISFHCLRHSAVTFLKHAGVPQAVVEELAGHSSAVVSRAYTHTSESQLLKGLESLSAL